MNMTMYEAQAAGMQERGSSVMQRGTADSVPTAANTLVGVVPSNYPQQLAAADWQRRPTRTKLYEQAADDGVGSTLTWSHKRSVQRELQPALTSAQ